MRNATVPPLIAARGKRLLRDAYLRDFRSRRAAIHNASSWKLERRQHFEEQESPSREAFRRGDWGLALRLLDAKRDSILRTLRQDRDNNSVLHRVRVVESPLTPYLQWELHSLRLQAELGKPIRVVTAEAVNPFETSGMLPEVVVLGSQVLYEVIYTEMGVPNGAIRFTDPDLVRCWEAFIQDLYHDGEDVVAYVDRRIAPLPPPQM
ncbi:DUF6879 family protein [Sinosporangium siamense]|uniref:DUF6879 domain-containing protein n=1 Tax=Sinosporangium siamense TaxID=1367973 RepID=A0A919V392_9ACTN|nr:DUF6879 family protein [Sinosporangium siamense]GII90735.1 hypothetical protein Ssi02_09660 [Sinosporangium siamense]